MIPLATPAVDILTFTKGAPVKLSPLTSFPLTKRYIFPVMISNVFVLVVAENFDKSTSITSLARVNAEADFEINSCKSSPSSAAITTLGSHTISNTNSILRHKLVKLLIK